MKKLLFSLAMLLTSVGAWAEDQTSGSNDFYESELFDYSTKFHNAEKGYHAATSGTWYAKFTITEQEAPTVVLEVTDETVDPIGVATKENYQRPWLQAGYVYHITLPENYYFSEYEITTQSTTSTNQSKFTYTTDSGQTESETQTVSNQTIKVTLSTVQTNTIKLDLTDYSQNDTHGILLYAFKFKYKTDFTTELQWIKAEAEILLASVEEYVGTEVGEYTEASVDALTLAIENAESVTEATLNDITDLETAMDGLKVNMPDASKTYILVSAYSSGNFTDKAAFSTGNGLRWKTKNEKDLYFYWKFTKNDDNTYTLRNVGTDKYVSGIPHNSQVQEGVTPLNLTLTFKGEKAFNIGTTVANQQFHFGGWNSGDRSEGNVIGWSDAGVSRWYIVEKAVEVGTINFTLTDEAGNVYTGNYEGVSEGETEPFFAGTTGYTFENKNWDGNTFTAKINFPFPVSKNNDVTNWTMISSFKNSNFKWYADDTSVKTKKQEEILESNVALHLWAIYPEYDNELQGFKFTIKNMVTESYIKKLGGENNDHSGDEVCLDAEPSYFTYVNMRFKDVNSNQCLSTNGSGEVDIQFLGTHSSTSHVGSQNVFPDVSYTTTITSAGAATLYTPIAVTIPANVTAKYVKAADNADSEGTLKYTTLSGIIPANTAVVLIGDGNNYTFTKSTETGETITDNVLFGYSIATTVASSEHSEVGQGGNIFALAEKSDVLGFYPFVGETYAAGKAYLDISDLPAAAQARFFNIFEEGTETAIESIEGAESADAVVYDLAGRRVKGAQKGLYIVNGKVVIK